MQHYDAVIVGSGAAGSVMAFQLASRGHSVLVLERGKRQDPQTFEHNEMEMLPRLYKNGGLQTSVDRDLVIMQGSTLGGSTVVNNAIWLRADLQRILPDWKSRGADLDEGRLNRAYDDLEHKLHVSPLPAALANKGTDVFLQGSQALTISAHLLKNNRDECIGCGWCNYGCRYNRKTSMLVTFIPWAESCGAEFIDQCRDIRFGIKGRAVTSVEFTRRGQTETVTADRLVVSAGAIGSTELLLKNDIKQRGNVGKHFHVLGGVMVTAEMLQPLNGYDGIGLTAVAEAGPESVIETFFSPPGAFSITLGGWFATHLERMRRYNYFAQAGVMVGTDPRGKISLDRKGNAKIDLSFNKTDLARLRRGLETLAKIYFAAGARSVLPATYRFMELTNPGDLHLLDDMIQHPDDLLLGSAHPQGGNVMHEDSDKGVVDTTFRVHGFDNLYVVDASVFPSNIWANCQATVMALAHTASDSVAQ
jgi:choline dehydrogenase-like flavoprotein